MSARSMILLALALGLAPLPGLGETFHVARDEPGASDANDGLSPVYVSGLRGPWETVRHAGQVATAGDTVFVHDGDYRAEQAGFGAGVIPLESSGRSGAPVRFVGAPDASPLLNTLLVRGREWIEIEGLTFISQHFELPDGWVDMPAVVVDDPGIVIDPAEPWLTREPKVRQKYATYMGMWDFFTTAFTNAIEISDSSHVTIRRNAMRFYTYGVQVKDRSTDVLIEDNRISYSMEGIFTWQESPSISDSVIRGNTFRQIFNNGMMIRESPTGVLVERNDLLYSGTTHIALLNGAVDNTVRGNVARHGGFYTETMEFPGSTAFVVHTSGGGNVVEGNFAAFHVDRTSYDGNGYIADLMRDGAGVTFRNNIAYRNMGSGIRTIESPNCLILNNTLVENGYRQPDRRVGAGISLARAEDVNHILVNNILVDNLTGGIKSSHTLASQWLVDHNLYRSANGAPYIWDGDLVGDRAYFTLQEVRANTGWEPAGVDGDPRFVDPALQNFRLLASSPAVDAGRATPIVPDDFDGVLRPRGEGYDVGAFESH